MQRNESPRGGDSDEFRQMVLRKVLGSQIVNAPPETEAMIRNSKLELECMIKPAAGP